MKPVGLGNTRISTGSGHHHGSFGMLRTCRSQMKPQSIHASKARLSFNSIQQLHMIHQTGWPSRVYFLGLLLFAIADYLGDQYVAIIHGDRCTDSCCGQAEESPVACVATLLHTHVSFPYYNKHKKAQPRYICHNCNKFIEAWQAQNRDNCPPVALARGHRL